MPITPANKKNTAVAVVAETTEGVYAAPASATSFTQVQTSGFELSGSKDLINRDVFTASIGVTSPRTGAYKVTGSAAVEARASSVEGGKPEYNNLMQSGMGAVRGSTAVVTTKATGNTASTLAIADADISQFNIGDMIKINEGGAHAVSPIIAISTATGAATITLLVPRATGSYPASVTISKFTTYIVADSGHPSFSVSKYIETTKVEQAVGCRVNSIALDSFSTGKLPSWKFGFEGLNFNTVLAARPFAPSYDTALAPIILGGAMYQNGNALAINALSITLSNTLGFQSDISQVNGRSSGRATGRTVKGTIDPYKSATEITQASLFQTGAAFSIFAYAKVPTANAGEFSQVVAIYIPNANITDLKEGEDSGLLKDQVEFSANRGLAGNIPEIYITFI